MCLELLQPCLTFSILLCVLLAFLLHHLQPSLPLLCLPRAARILKRVELGLGLELGELLLALSVGLGVSIDVALELGDAGLGDNASLALA
jgi:hypothetical protein